jgi:Holliday junction resolvase RusA-like endonuclease
VTLAIHIDMAMYPSWSKKKKERMRGQMVDHTPDSVNIAAGVFDGLTGIAYKDDKQVSDFTVTRRWQDDGSSRYELTPQEIEP